jgi:hypothetical protein
VSEAVTSERTSPVRKHSQQFPPGTKLSDTKSSRKNLFVVDDYKAIKRQRSNDTIATLSLELNEQSS